LRPSPPERLKALRLFVFGPGYVGLAFARRLAKEGWRAGASARDAAVADGLAQLGMDPIDPRDSAALAAALAVADAVLVTAPPDAGGCPATGPIAAALASSGARPGWIGYLSSTGVYGDREGRWVFEDGALAAQSVTGARRVAAEAAWLDLGRRTGLAVSVFRLPGIYGPGRSAFDRLRDGTARRLIRPGQVFSRIHRDDLTAALAAWIARPRGGGIYNLCDDEPCPPQDVIVEAARLIGAAPPPEVAFDAAQAPEAALRFFAESKRVSNARAKAELGWRPAYPSYREGLRAILEEP
jgi:nucleoside-diphosphate-sugar epimerase